MAKNVVFDSERYEKQQTIKRYAIPAAVLLGIVLIAVLAALILRGSRGKPVTGGDDTPYPYTWVRNKNGSVTLEIDRAAAPDYRWVSVISSGNMAAEVAQDDAKGKSRFALTPRAEGRCVLEFRLQREDDPDDCIYAMTALSDTAYDGKNMRTELIAVSGRAQLGIVRGGEDSLTPYIVRQDGDGDVMVMITDLEPAGSEESEPPDEGSGEKKPEPWECTSGDEAVAAHIGTMTNGSLVTVYLRSGTAPGTTQVRIRKTETGTELVLDFELDESGTLLLTAHSLHAGVLPTETEG